MMIITLECAVCEYSGGSLKSETFKKGRLLGQGVRLKHSFIKQRAGDYSIRRRCLTLQAHLRGYCAGLSEPQSARAK